MWGLPAMTEESSKSTLQLPLDEIGFAAAGALIVGFSVRYVFGLAKRDMDERSQLEMDLRAVRAKLDEVHEESNENKIHWKECEADKAQIHGRLVRMERFLTRMDPEKFDIFEDVLEEKDDS